MIKKTLKWNNDGYTIDANWRADKNRERYICDVALRQYFNIPDQVKILDVIVVGEKPEGRDWISIKLVECYGYYAILDGEDKEEIWHWAWNDIHDEFGYEEAYAWIEL